MKRTPRPLGPAPETREMIVAYGPGEFSLPPLGYLERVVVRDAAGNLVLDEKHNLTLLQVANTVTPRYTIDAGQHLVMFYAEIIRVPA